MTGNRFPDPLVQRCTPWHTRSLLLDLFYHLETVSISSFLSPKSDPMPNESKQDKEKTHWRSFFIIFSSHNVSPEFRFLNSLERDSLKRVQIIMH